MARENVELVVEVRGLLEGVDLVPLLQDDKAWAALGETLASYYHEDVECRMSRLGGASYTGREGLRAAWLDWLAPWASYRVEAHDPIDLGDRVLLPSFNFGCLHGGTEEVRMDAAAVFTLREGKVACVEFYSDRAAALNAVGLI